MRHLLSPALPGKDARREYFLNQAESFSTLVELIEAHYHALKFSTLESHQNKARECLSEMIRARRIIQTCLARATALTDYTNPLDRPSEGWAILSALREEAEYRALSPAQLRSAILNPRTTSLLPYRHAC